MGNHFGAHIWVIPLVMTMRMFLYETDVPSDVFSVHAGFPLLILIVCVSIKTKINYNLMDLVAHIIHAACLKAKHIRVFRVSIMICDISSQYALNSIIYNNSICPLVNTLLYKCLWVKMQTFFGGYIAMKVAKERETSWVSKIMIIIE